MRARCNMRNAVCMVVCERLELVTHGRFSRYALFPAPVLADGATPTPSDHAAVGIGKGLGQPSPVAPGMEAGYAAAASFSFTFALSARTQIHKRARAHTDAPSGRPPTHTQTGSPHVPFRSRGLLYCGTLWIASQRFLLDDVHLSQNHDRQKDWVF